MSVLALLAAAWFLFELVCPAHDSRDSYEIAPNDEDEYEYGNIIRRNSKK